VQAPDCVRKQWRRWQNREFVARRFNAESEWRNSIGHDNLIDRRIGKYLRRAGHEKAMHDERNDALRTGFASGASGTQKSATGTDQIIYDESGGASDITDEQVTGNNTSAAVLVNKGLADGMTARGLQRLPEQFSPFCTTGIGRHHTDNVASQ